jgi:sugar lactone lactonase YvrE
MSTKVELVVDSHDQLGEGPIWDAQGNILYWVDIMGQKVQSFDPATSRHTQLNIGQAVGTVVPRANGGLMVAVQHGFAALDTQTKQLTIIHDPESHLPDNRFNDGKCDPAGRFWAGTMAFEPKGKEGSLYCMETDLSVRKMIDHVTISNGIVWNLDHTRMYYIDSPTYVVRCYDYDVVSGQIQNDCVLFNVPREMGTPDGMAIDRQGRLWIAHYGGSQICCWDPETGRIVQTIELPVSQVTACAFGGSELDTLYITSRSLGLSEDQIKQEPHAGALLSVKPGCQGVETFSFRG